MKFYQTVLVEDSPDDRDKLVGYVQQLPLLHLTQVFDHPADARRYLTTHPTDLLFLDLHLPQQSGFDLLRELTNPPVVILTTLSLTNALDAYELGIADYLVKPFGFERFERAVNRAVPGLEARALATSVVVLKEGHKSVQVSLDAILYIEAYGPFCRVYLTGRTLLVSHLISDIQERLAAHSFMRVHRSWIVAVAKVNGIAARQLTVGEQVIPIGDSYRARVKERFIR